VKDEKKISLVLGSHAHVPSGAPESEFESVYQNRMLPFVSNLYRYSKINAVIHYSGVLLYWAERTHPEFFMLIEEMVNKKQIEILGGGFYEPMFPLIPLQDRIGQIEFMTTYLRKHFGKRPLGCRISGMTWEPHLANTLCASDMNYTFLSQDQFKLAGIKSSALFYPCISEDQGKLVTIFPVSSSVEKNLEEKSFSLCFLELKGKFTEEYKPGSNSDFFDEKIVCIFPEKVSSSPEEPPDAAWSRFFEEISLSDEFVETTLPSKILKNHKPFKKASFPDSSSYGNDFSPRRFIIENDEANSIYSKMIFTNVLINQLKGDKSRKVNAREELWKAQDSCLFSPGNGHLRSELRKAAYSSLLRAERLTRDKGKSMLSVIQHDFNFDGNKEFLFQGSSLNCYIRQKGASIFELDYMPIEWNYLDCGVSKTGRRMAFADYLLPLDAKIDSPETFSGKKVRFCFNEEYEAIAQDKKGKYCFKLNPASGNVPFGGMEIHKCYLLKKDNCTVFYTLKNTGKNKQDFLFMPEINFSFAGFGDEYVRFYSTDTGGKDVPAEKNLNTSGLKINDVKNEGQILLSSVVSFSGCILPAFNDNMYQATCILPVFTLSLESGESWNNEFCLKLSH